MDLIPGKNNVPGSITDSTCYQYHKTPLTNQNRAFYHKGCNVKSKDAMGSTVIKYGFSDQSLFLAHTDHSDIANLSMKESSTERSVRVTYAIPMAIVYTSPLTNWNPYNIAFDNNPYSAQGLEVKANDEGTVGCEFDSI